ncbi:Fpg/Nei family DNA glycosylase [Nesterenkonia populi]|uniref:Fpg/Nei family DNA glycosylase n=1 Tax=Nesterenkonia populi TaxID=1591087 RepID=UPI0011BFC7CE|nr:DNA-formamidopyrimidine glycosylase family protein [Nesterenkonia populi]
MPEGHTLHRLASQINRLFAGRTWRVTSPQGRFDAGAARLTGRAPERAEAHGKQLFVHLGPDIWQVHLGLYGAFSFRGDESFSGADTLGAPRTKTQTLSPEYDEAGWIVPEAPAGAVRARVHVPNGWADLRGPSKCQVLSPMQYEAVTRRLGPDPLHQPDGQIDAALAAQFQQNLARRRVSVGAALMDQAVIAGVGNIYRAESLFAEGISPDVASAVLAEEQSAALWARLTAQLRDGVAEGRIRTLRPGEERRQPQRRHWVYQHQGTPCLRCGEIIRMRELQGRRLYWCPGCQLVP